MEDLQLFVWHAEVSLRIILCANLPVLVAIDGLVASCVLLHLLSQLHLSLSDFALEGLVAIRGEVLDDFVGLEEVPPSHNILEGLLNHVPDLLVLCLCRWKQALAEELIEANREHGLQPLLVLVLKLSLAA